jgi:hypothetical protein
MSRMLGMLRDLVAHNGHANAAVLAAIRQNDATASDPELCQLLHHILVANRFWLLIILGLPFVFDDESRPSSSFDELIQRTAGLTNSSPRGWQPRRNLISHGCWKALSSRVARVPSHRR